MIKKTKLDILVAGVGTTKVAEEVQKIAENVGLKTEIKTFEGVPDEAPSNTDLLIYIYEKAYEVPKWFDYFESRLEFDTRGIDTNMIFRTLRAISRLPTISK